ncbi:hypothetical protein CDD83_7944 [Cordyceps sp. RAO-2017]|nr:hypothetical protein CDD83_7944 [Cordyceps sp. RAO-2017]
MPSATPGAPTAAAIEADFIIVGAGFSGCLALHELRRQGYSAKILEAASDFGGVWHANRYPGVRVDSETPLYQLGMPKVWDSFSFTQRFPGGDELRRYFAHLDETLHLRKDTLFHARVCRAERDSASNTWSFVTESGLTATSRYAVFAAGTTNKPHRPAYPNIDSFKGTVLHPAAWPEDVNVQGKRVGVVGQGATGVQIVQELAKEDCHLDVFVRNPCIAIPMGQRQIPPRESEEMKNLNEGLFFKAKYLSNGGFAHNDSLGPFHSQSKKERLEQYERMWSRGGFAFLLGVYRDYGVNREANAEMYSFWASKTRTRLADPVKRDIVAPLEQFQWFGTKRPSLEMDYYEMLDRPNVSLVDLKSTPIREFSETGVVTSDGKEHALDVVVLATGYDSVTGSLYDMNIHDEDGVLLQERWRDGIKTYVGMMAPGFPNAFFLYGPQAPTSLVNGPPFLELQVEWITELLQRAKEDDVQSLAVSAEAADGWTEASWQVFRSVLHHETDSWWTGANIPGKNREPLIWFGGLRSWWNECSEALKDWSKFAVRDQLATHTETSASERE